MKSLAERLRGTRQQKGWNQSQLARQAGIAPQVIQLIEAGKVLQSKHIFAIAHILDVTAEWLLTGSAGNFAPARGGAAQLEDKHFGAKKSAADEVPIYAAAPTADSALFSLNKAQVIGYVAYHPRQVGMHGAFAFYCVGDVMSPRYEHGDLIYCLPNQPLRPGQDIVILFLNDHEAILRRFVKQDRATQKLHCEQFHPPGKQTINPKEIVEIFSVVGRG